MINLINWNRFAFIYIILAPLQYIICSAIAMVFYPGGTLFDPLTSGFHFWGNYFSDLGRTIAISGESNFISFVIFTPSALILSLSFIPLIIYMPRFFKEHKRQYKLSIIGSVFGALTSVSLLLTILTPWDLFSEVHLIFASLFNIFGSLIALFYFVIILMKKDYPKIYAIAFFFLLMLAVIYIIIGIITANFPNSEKILIQATYQKFSQYSFLLCYSFQGYGAIKYLKKEIRSK